MDFQVSKFEGDRLQIVFFFCYICLNVVTIHQCTIPPLASDPFNCIPTAELFFFTHNVSSNDCLALRT